MFYECSSSVDDVDHFVMQYFGVADQPKQTLQKLPAEQTHYTSNCAGLSCSTPLTQHQSGPRWQPHYAHVLSQCWFNVGSASQTPMGQHMVVAGRSHVDNVCRGGYYQGHWPCPHTTEHGVSQSSFFLDDLRIISDASRSVTDHRNLMCLRAALLTVSNRSQEFNACTCCSAKNSVIWRASSFSQTPWSGTDIGPMQLDHGWLKTNRH